MPGPGGGEPRWTGAATPQPKEPAAAVTATTVAAAGGHMPVGTLDFEVDNMSK